MFLLDTNVISELRKIQRQPEKVREWFRMRRPNDLFISVITVGEIRRGIEDKRLKDAAQAVILDAWMTRTLSIFSGHTLPVTKEIADRWGALCPGQAMSPADGLIAATALEHDLVCVTRNVRHFKRSGVRLFNPWEDHD